MKRQGKQSRREADVLRKRETEKEKEKDREPGGGGVRGRRSTAWLTNRGSLQSQADEKERRRKGEG